MRFLLIGLGNIGDAYAHTRHNIGFDIAAAFVHKYDGVFKLDRLAYMAEIKIKGKSVICICPTTFMNVSGKAVKYWMDKEKLSPERSLTLLDDISLPLSKIRIKATGSDGGHNGLKSIQASLDSIAYPKLRFGIGNNFPKGMQADFVLGKWKKEEEGLVKLKIEKSVEAIEVFILQGIAPAMNLVNNKEYSL